MPFSSVCDAYIINSCTVTGESDRKVMQACRRAIKTNPDAFVCVIGCMAQISSEKLAAIPGIGFVGGNVSKKQVVDEILRRAEGTGPSRIDNAVSLRSPLIRVRPFESGIPYEPLSLSATGHTRAVIKIEDGCDSACSYCIIHTARGPARSRPESDVLSETERLAKAGYKEVILTGIELSSYKGDLPGLVTAAGNIDGIERIRLGSLDPYYLTKERIDRLAEAPKLMPHFHISLQSGSSRVLAAMRRKYNADTALERILYLREKFPRAMFFADVIVGFPGETEQDFQETVGFIQKIRFLHLHIFPYSKRAGTVAARMPDQIPRDLKRERASLLHSVQCGIKKEILEEVVREGDKGRLLKVLCEEGQRGHSEEFIEVKAAASPFGGFPAASDIPADAPACFRKGEIITARPLYTDGDVIYAAAVKTD